MEEKEEQNGEGDTGSGISPKVFVALALPPKAFGAPCFGSFFVFSRDIRAIESGKHLRGFD